MPEDYLSGDFLYRDIITYASFGEHRACTTADIRTVLWVKEEFEKVGLKSELQEFPILQFFPEKIRLEVNGKLIEAFPPWYPLATGSGPIRAPLVLSNGQPAMESVEGKIAVVLFPEEWGPGITQKHERLILDSAEAGAAAVLAVCEEFSGEFSGRTRGVKATKHPDKPEPWPVPVLMAGSRDKQFLVEAAGKASEASFFLKGTYDQQAMARNVMGKWETGERLIVVSTPLSGWFQCAGERGPGVALLLSLARWVGSRQPKTSYLFLASAAHELGGLGMFHFMRTKAPSPGRVLCWLHLGASIALWDWVKTGRHITRSKDIEKRRFLACVPELHPLLKENFAGIPGLPPYIDSPNTPARGELRTIIDTGYRSFGFFGIHKKFHTRSDTPETTSPEILEPVGSAIAATLTRLEQDCRCSSLSLWL